MKVSPDLVQKKIDALPIVCDECLPEAQFSEHVDDGFHGGFIGDGDQCHAQDVIQCQWWRAETLYR